MLSENDYEENCARKSSLKGLLKAFKGKGELQELAHRALSSQPAASAALCPDQPENTGEQPAVVSR